MFRVVPPRIHVLLARETSLAVVIRRGPTRRTALLGWDRKTDEFQLGQWFSGRIYERRCDLSPNGKHLIYFAMNGRGSSSTQGSWTAISRAPYLKAISLFMKGDCWHGGGLFQSSTTYWLNDGYGHYVQKDDQSLSRSLDHPWHEQYGGECRGVYYIRLQRDGWHMKYTAPDGQGGEVTLFEKYIKNHWHLRKYAHASPNHPIGRSIYYDTHELFNRRTEETCPQIDWEWADVDGERLVWAANGYLLAGHVKAQGLENEKILYDFNVMQFEKTLVPY